MIAGRKLQSSSLSATCASIIHCTLFKKLATLNLIIMATHHEQERRQQPEVTKQPLKKRAVVSSFIFEFPEDGKGKPVVALFRRSDKVNTYQ